MLKSHHEAKEWIAESISFMKGGCYQKNTINRNSGIQRRQNHSFNFRQSERSAIVGWC